MRILTSLLAAAAIALPTLFAANARGEDAFYQGKNLTFLVAADVGGGYDLYARALAPYLKQHLPGHPTIIVQNMPGAGGIVMANYMARNAKADGTVIGLMLSPVALNQLTRPKQIGYDARKFVWLGTIDAQTNVLFVGSAKTAVRSLADAKKTEVVIGATNANSFLYQEPKLMNALLQTRFKVVGGYKGVRDLDLALERGEIEGHVSPWSTVKSEHPDWLKDGKIINIIATGADADDLPGVPKFADLVQDPAGKALVRLIDMSSILGRSVAAPAGLPAARTAELRTAIGAAVNDPAFHAEMAQRKLPVQYRSGEKLQAYVEEALKTPPEAVAEFLKIVNTK
jgi:tripartite-type tricarboxylate transporter receptor subunit TctC